MKKTTINFIVPPALKKAFQKAVKKNDADKSKVLRKFMHDYVLGAESHPEKGGKS